MYSSAIRRVEPPHIKARGLCFLVRRIYGDWKLILHACFCSLCHLLLYDVITTIIIIILIWLLIIIIIIIVKNEKNLSRRQKSAVK